MSSLMQWPILVDHYTFDLLEEWYINGDKNKNGDEFKTDVEVQKELNDALKEMRGKIKTGPDDFSATIKNWYDVKDSELKKLIKRLVSR